MRLSPRILLPLLSCLLLLSGCGDSGDVPEDSGPPVDASVDWDSLMPADWDPDAIYERFASQGIDELSDEDQKAIDLLAELRQAWDKAPLVPELDGRRVRLSGFVVPIAWADTRMTEFLLVPYYGACIHVPPPPANQTVDVLAPPEHPYEGSLLDAVTITGTLRVMTVHDPRATAGYRIEATRIEPYDPGSMP